MSSKKSKPDNLKNLVKAREAAIVTYATAINVHLCAAAGMAAAYFDPSIDRCFDCAKESSTKIYDGPPKITD